MPVNTKDLAELITFADHMAANAKTAEAEATYQGMSLAFTFMLEQEKATDSTAERIASESVCYVSSDRKLWRGKSGPMFRRSAV